MSANMTLGASTAIGIGVGAALAASMGPAGFAAGLAAALLLFWRSPRRPRPSKPRA